MPKTNTNNKITLIDEAKVIKASKSMPYESDILDLSDSFKMLGDSTRLKILFALKNEELCVGDISSLISTSISAVSHQLRLLRNYRYVKHRKDGKMVYYSLADKHIINIISEALTHSQE
jgi:DNA-binding transcriptional ArsR family regulator